MVSKPQSAVIVQGHLAPGAFKDIPAEAACVVPEGRPSLAALRSTCALLQEMGRVPVVISDNMEGFLFSQGGVREVRAACHAREPDGFLCESGALVLAVLAKTHGVALKIFPAIRRKKRVMGREGELFSFNGVRVAPKGIRAYVPLLEWVPRQYVTEAYD